jgi:hypothetical protein
MRLPVFLSRSHHHRLLVTVCLAAIALGAACGIGIRRDLSTIPPGQVGFDDMCGLQDYFDTLEAKLATPPSLVSAVDMENQANARVQGGKNRFSFETEFQLKQLHRVLDDNWKSLPEPLAKADRIDIEVHWSAKAGVQRVVTDSDAELIVGRESFALPYQVCLSELLFGAPLYRQRRLMAGRGLPYKSLLGDASKADGADAGTPAAVPATVATPATTTPTAPPTPSPTPTPTPAPTVAASPMPTPTVVPTAPAAAPAPARPAPPVSNGTAPAAPVFKQAPPAQ